MRDVPAVVRALGRRSCTLVAHDWGGALAWAVAGTFPEVGACTLGRGGLRERGQEGRDLPICVRSGTVRVGEAVDGQEVVPSTGWLRRRMWAGLSSSGDRDGESQELVGDRIPT